MKANVSRIAIFLLLVILTGCASLGKGDYYKDPTMDFGSVKTVAVLPFANLSREQEAAERVRDIFANTLLATGVLYVVPTGEVARGITRAGIGSAVAPSVDEIKKLGALIHVDAVITGVIREYGELRAGSSASNVVSLSLQMIETQTGRVIWSASDTVGRVTAWDRLFGGGGKPMNDVTEKAVNDLISSLF
jgi:hypothetical protein